MSPRLMQPTLTMSLLRHSCYFFLWALPLLLVFLFLAFGFVFFAALCLGHPVGVIGVLVCISAPFCATNAVGIASFAVQRLAVAANAE